MTSSTRFLCLQPLYRNGKSSNVHDLPGYCQLKKKKSHIDDIQTILLIMVIDTSIHQCSNTAAHSVSFILSHVLKPLTHCMSESESALLAEYVRHTMNLIQWLLMYWQWQEVITTCNFHPSLYISVCVHVKNIDIMC